MRKKRILRHLSALLLAICTAIAGDASLALASDPPQIPESRTVGLAERRAAEAYDAYTRRDYVSAVALYLEAYDTSPSGMVLYNIARAYGDYVAKRGGDDHELLRDLSAATLGQALASPSTILKLRAIATIEELELGDLGQVVGQPSDPEQQVGQRSSRHAVRQPGGGDELVRVPVGQRGEPGRPRSGTQRDQRAERVVVGHPDGQLGARRGQVGQRQPVAAQQRGGLLRAEPALVRGILHQGAGVSGPDVGELRHVAAGFGPPGAVAGRAGQRPHRDLR